MSSNLNTISTIDTQNTQSMSGYITIEEHTEALNNVIDMCNVTSTLISLILIKLIISSCCKAILKTMSINVKRLYFYDVFSFAYILFNIKYPELLLSETAVASTSLHVFEAFLFGFPAIITILELRKKRLSSKKSSEEKTVA